MMKKEKSFSSAAVGDLSGMKACFQTWFHLAAIFNVKEREEMMCWTGASVLLNHERRLRGL